MSVKYYYSQSPLIFFMLDKDGHMVRGGIDSRTMSDLVKEFALNGVKLSKHHVIRIRQTQTFINSDHDLRKINVYRPFFDVFFREIKEEEEEEETMKEKWKSLLYDV